MRHAVLLPIATSLLFAGSFVAGELTTRELKPLSITLFRYFFALIFLEIVRRLTKPRVPRLSAKEWAAMALLGWTGIVGYHYFFFLALRHTEIANTAIINALSPILTGLLAAYFLGERLSWRNYAGVLLAVLGVWILVARGEWARIWTVGKGEQLMFLGLFSWILYSLVVKRLATRLSGFTITYCSTLCGVAWLILLASLESFWNEWREVDSSLFLAILYMGVCASGIGYLVYNLAIIQLGPTQTAGLINSLVPVLVAVLAYLFFAEPITWPMVASTGLILIGMRYMLIESNMDRSTQKPHTDQGSSTA